MNTVSTDTEKQPLLRSDRSPPRNDGPEPSTQSLRQLQEAVWQAQHRYLAAWSRTSSGKWHVRIMYAVTFLLAFVMLFSLSVIVQDALLPSPASSKIPLEAHIMSKCPDARDCLRDLILPTMQEVGELVDFRLSYIGSETDHDEGVLCMHGPSECLGNIIELCAAELYSEKQALGFTWCLSREYSHIPDQALIQDCALEHGLSLQKLNDCAVDEDGSLIVKKLRSSFRRSAEANVTTSCTVRLDEQVRCVRDGGEWKDCDGGHSVDSLVKDIRKLAE